jgi:hypothetical protein
MPFRRDRDIRSGSREISECPLDGSGAAREDHLSRTVWASNPLYPVVACFSRFSEGHEMKQTLALWTILIVGLSLSGAEKEKEQKDAQAAKVTVSGGLGSFTQVAMQELKDGKLQSYNATVVKLKELEKLRIAVRGSLQGDEIVKLLPGVTGEGTIRPDGKEMVLDGTVRGRDEKEKDKNLAKGQALVEGELVKGEKGSLAIANGKWPIALIGEGSGKIADAKGKVRVTGQLRLTEKGGLEVVVETAEEVKERNEK